MKKDEKYTKHQLKLYANQLGYYPSAREWNEHIKTNHLTGCYTSVGLIQALGMNWESIRKDMEFPPRTKRWTKEECIEAVKKAAQALGDFVSQDQYEEYVSERPDFPTLPQIKRRCKSWNEAKIEAGLIPNESVSNSFTDEDCIAALNTCANDLGKTLFSEAEFIEWRSKQTENYPHIETIRQRLGGLEQAKTLIGMDSYPAGKRKDTWDDIIERRAKFLAFLNDVLSEKSYNEWAMQNNAPSDNVLRVRDGGYQAVLFEMLDVYVQRKKAGIKR